MAKRLVDTSFICLTNPTRNSLIHKSIQSFEKWRKLTTEWNMLGHVERFSRSQTYETFPDNNLYYSRCVNTLLCFPLFLVLVTFFSHFTREWKILESILELLINYTRFFIHHYVTREMKWKWQQLSRK